MTNSSFLSKLIKLLEGGSDISSLLQELMKNINRPVLITDKNWQVINQEMPSHNPWVPGTHLKVKLPIKPLEKLSTKEELWYQVSIVIKQKTLKATLLKLKYLDLYELNLLIVESFAKLTAREIEMILAIGIVMTTELAKKHAVSCHQLKYKADFIYDLLYNNYEMIDEIIERGRLWGWDFSKPHLLCLYSLEGINPFVSQSSSTEGLANLVEETLSHYKPYAIVLPKGDEVVSLLPVEANLTIADHNKLIIKILAELAKTTGWQINGHNYWVGMGDYYPKVQDLNRSYQQAKVAIEMGKLLGESQKIHFFSQMGVIRLLASLTPQKLDDFYQQTIGKLRIHEAKMGFSLIETLYHWFAANTDLNSAAKSLFIHVNTLRYRLKKIEELLGINLESLVDKNNLFIGMQIHLLTNFDENCTYEK